jgi:hypothetical protein
MTLVNNKMVNCAELRVSLEARFGALTYFDDKLEIENAVDAFIEEKVVLQAWNEIDIDENSKFLIDEIIDNIDELRDTQRDFCNELSEKLFN